MQNQLIAGHSKFAIVQLKQDWEFLCSVYGFKTWGAKEFCPFCDAARDSESWFQGGARASWRSTVWDHTKLTQALKGQVYLPDGTRSTKVKWASKLWMIPHMLFKYIKADAMHVLLVDGVVNKACAMHHSKHRNKLMDGIEHRASATNKAHTEQTNSETKQHATSF